MSRYLNVILPLFALAAAFTVTRAARASAARGPAVATALTLAAMVPGFATSVRTDLFFRQADTRTIAREYIERTIPTGSTILVQPYSAPVRRSRESLIEALRKNLGSEERASIKFQLMLASDSHRPAYRLIYLGEGGEDPDKIYVSPKAFETGGLAPLQQLGVQYVVLKQGNVPNPALAALEAALRREGRRIAAFTPYRADADAASRADVPPYLHNTAARIDSALERPGPGLEIWDIQLNGGR
jgi:hypothetical protein